MGMQLTSPECSCARYSSAYKAVEDTTGIVEQTCVGIEHLVVYMKAEIRKWA